MLGIGLFCTISHFLVSLRSSPCWNWFWSICKSRIWKILVSNFIQFLFIPTHSRYLSIGFYLCSIRTFWYHMILHPYYLFCNRMIYASVLLFCRTESTVHRQTAWSAHSQSHPSFLWALWIYLRLKDFQRDLSRQLSLKFSWHSLGLWHYFHFCFSYYLWGLAAQNTCPRLPCYRWRSPQLLHHLY